MDWRRWTQAVSVTSDIASRSPISLPNNNDFIVKHTRYWEVDKQVRFFAQFFTFLKHVKKINFRHLRSGFQARVNGLIFFQKKANLRNNCNILEIHFKLSAHYKK